MAQGDRESVERDKRQLRGLVNEYRNNPSPEVWESIEWLFDAALMDARMFGFSQGESYGKDSANLYNKENND